MYIHIKKTFVCVKKHRDTYIYTHTYIYVYVYIYMSSPKFTVLHKQSQFITETE